MPAYERSREIRHAVGAHGEVSLRTVSAPVRVHGVEGNEARVVLRYTLRAPDEAAAARIEEEFMARLERGEGRLAASSGDARHVLIDGPGPFAALARAFGVGGDRSMELEADVPRGASISVETVSGDVVADGLEGTQRYHTLSGDVVLACAGGLRVDTTSGDTSVQAPGPASLEWHSVSGDIRAAAPGWGQVRLDTLSGDAWIAGRLGESAEHRARSVSGDLRLAVTGGVRVDARAVSGTIRSEVEHRVQGRAGHGSVLVGDGAARLSFESMSGDLILLRPTEPDGRTGEGARAAEPVSATGVIATHGTGDAGAAGAGSAASTAGHPGEAPAADQSDQLALLRALERGEIDVDEALRRMQEVGRA
jgi:hypothetical protein